jgi:hypothetical protein
MFIRPSRIGTVIALAVTSIGLGLAALGAAVVIAPGTASADIGCVSSGTTTVTVSCPVGTGDTWTVPTGVTQAIFTVFGAAGGSSFGAGGPGGEVQATLTVTAGSVYDIEVGGVGANSTSNTTNASGGAPGGGTGGENCFFFCWASGGGGGGYWGGGGGYWGLAGGGGSGFITPGALSSAFLTPTNPGNGSVTISYTLPSLPATCPNYYYHHHHHVGPWNHTHHHHHQYPYCYGYDGYPHP